MPRSRVADLARAASLAARGELNCARDLCAGAVAEDPADAAALHLLGSISAAEGDLEAAESLLLQALAHDSKPAWHRDLAVIYAARKQWGPAVEAFQASGTEVSAHSSTLVLYARALFETGDLPGAECAAGQVLAAEPDSVEALALLADIQVMSFRNEQESHTRRRILQLRPDDSQAHAQMGASLCQLGEFAPGAAHLRRALDLDPAGSGTHSALLNALLYDPDLDRNRLRDAHLEWARRHCAPEPSASFPNSPDPDRRLRIGYICGECESTPSFQFLISIFRNHDPNRFHTFYYRTTEGEGECTRAYRQTFAEWRDVSRLSHAQIADLIRRDGLDILVDTGGHYGRHVLPALALRPAPVQVSFPNYPCTTGVTQIHYILTDRWTCPPGEESQYAEQAYRVPSGYLVFHRPDLVLPITPLPAARSGAVTFGLFQRPAKINPRVWDAVAQVLLQVPGSRLLVHFCSAELDDADGPARARIECQLAARGVSHERLRFRGRLNPAEHVAVLAEADIALDTFPYNGQTTSCECLWMGVPVVTLAGDAHVSRVGSALLHRVGLHSWVARSPAEYVRIATRAASDLPALAALRACLRERVEASSLFDGPKITREIEDAYRCMWQRWCSSQKKEEVCQAAAKS